MLNIGVSNTRRRPMESYLIKVLFHRYGVQNPEKIEMAADTENRIATCRGENAWVKKKMTLLEGPFPNTDVTETLFPPKWRPETLHA